MIGQDIQLGFTTHLGNTLNIRIPHARQNLTTADVVNAMDGMIASNAVLATQGRPTTRQSARLIQRHQTAFVLNN